MPDPLTFGSWSIQALLTALELLLLRWSQVLLPANKGPCASLEGGLSSLWPLL